MQVNLDNEFVKIAQSHSAVERRSLADQIQHWAEVGKIVEDNPDLSYSVIKEILLGIEDVRAGNTEEYKPGTL